MMTSPRDDVMRKEQEVVKDLLEALKDDELTDVDLVAADGVVVPACRFVLAARSNVLKRMLYGSFREAKTCTVSVSGYDSQILKAVVDYCRSNQVETFANTLDKGERGTRRLVELSKAADYFELTGMQQQIDRMIRDMMTKHPQLACAVFDEAGPESPLWEEAFRIIEIRPYVALEATEQSIGGGIECLGAGRLIDVIKNPFIAAGELFLFRMLCRWFEHASSSESCYDVALETAHKCCRHMMFENIEPQVLLDEVQGYVFVSPDRIFDAVAKQALRASQDRAWNLRCRGRDSVERILVEGCGSRDANGIYYRIAAFENGGLYSKRETSAGQENVYTLSCSAKDNKAGQPLRECRLICSKLLTNHAVQSLCHMQLTSTINPLFQPIMQVLSIEPPEQSKNDVPTPIRKYYRVRLSDGEFHMHGTLSASIQSVVEKNEVIENSLVKVLQFGLYQIDGCTGVHVSSLSIVSSSSGQCIGCPKRLSSVLEAEMKEITGSSSELDDEDRSGLQTLYSCNAVVVPSGSCNNRDTPIPRSGWNVEGHGEFPGPICTRIPASSAPVAIMADSSGSASEKSGSEKNSP